MVQVQGKWVLQKIQPGAVAEHMFNPSKLVRIIPDVHYIIRKTPNHILCVLRPPIAVLNLDDLFIDIVRQPDATEKGFAFQIVMTSNRQRQQTLFEGHGQIDLHAEGQNTCTTFTLSGRCMGRFEKVGNMFLETQMRAGLRRFFTNFADLIDGQVPTTATYIPPRETTRETVAVAGGAAALMLGWMTYRWWQKSR